MKKPAAKYNGHFARNHNEQTGYVLYIGYDMKTAEHWQKWQQSDMME